MSLYWVQSLDSEFQKNPHFWKNFSKKFLESFSSVSDKFQVSSIKDIDFNEIDFTNIKELMNEKKEIAKNKTKEEKELTRLKNEKINNEYSSSILDGTVEKIGNF